jgi:hypothetical protein
MALHWASSTINNRQMLNQRILAQLQVEAEWTDEKTGKTIAVEGLTENVGESGALVNLDRLPPVGSEVKLRVKDENQTLIEIPAEVIRVERDPSKPLAALSVARRLNEWRDRVWTAAQAWVVRNWKIDYEEEWVN